MYSFTSARRASYKLAIILLALLVLCLNQSSARATPGAENWDERFFLNGLNDTVAVLIVDGSGNLYADGDFTIADGVAVNRQMGWRCLVRPRLWDE